MLSYRQLLTVLVHTLAECRLPAQHEMMESQSYWVADEHSQTSGEKESQMFLSWKRKLWRCDCKYWTLLLFVVEVCWLWTLMFLSNISIVCQIDNSQSPHWYSLILIIDLFESCRGFMLVLFTIQQHFLGCGGEEEVVTGMTDYNLPIIIIWGTSTQKKREKAVDDIARCENQHCPS